MGDSLTKIEKFTKLYCEEHKIFGLIQKQNWFITGIVTGFLSALLGAFVDESTTLGYVGFAIGAILDYFMRKDYLNELEKFMHDRSAYNLDLND
tara:strand:+ start:283 stop:564 length:282 start_codon:yes stop_codon:yes gene_type:complete